MYTLKRSIHCAHGFPGAKTLSGMLGEYERNLVDHELEASDLQAF